MSRHIFEPDEYHHTLAARAPVLIIRSGDTVEMKIPDARGGDHEQVDRTRRGNPVVGPIAVEDAVPGDALELIFEAIWPTRTSAFSGAVIAPHLVEPRMVRQLPEIDRVFWRMQLEEGYAELESPISKRSSYRLPLAPFLGCFGVAPGGAQSISTATSGPHGGNMDYSGFQTGVRISLPVFVEGGLVYMGDGHALQGAGEITGMGLETSMAVRVRITRLAHAAIHWPRGESATHLFTIGNARPLEQALQHANSEMLHWLQQSYGMTIVEASTLLGQAVHYELGNLVNPAYTVACKLDKRLLAVE